MFIEPLNLVTQELLGADSKACPPEEDVEALCQILITVGKQLYENQRSRGINDMYFLRLKELAMHPQLELRLRFMVQSVIDLRANDWVPRREEVRFYLFRRKFFNNKQCSVFDPCLRVALL